MDYEQKYKDALERAKKYKLKEDLIITQDIFPELAESEDERIRKAIVRVFNEHKPEEHFYGVECFKILTWLEKQGKKEPIGFYYVNSDGKKFYSDTFKYGDVILHVEKQGEQKPFEMKSAEESLGISSEEYNKIVDECIFGEQKQYPKFKVGDRVMYKPQFRMPDDDTPLQNTVREIIGIENGWYKCDKGCSFNIEDQDRFELVKQKPAEWTEEEIIMKGEITNLLQKSGHYEKEIDWLKSLRPHPKQEWTEEDDYMVDKILTPLAVHYCNSEYQPIYDWLKQLKERIGG